MQENIPKAPPLPMTRQANVLFLCSYETNISIGRPAAPYPAPCTSAASRHQAGCTYPLMHWLAGPAGWQGPPHTLDAIVMYSWQEVNQ
jgi:hypothetical protein